MAGMMGRRSAKPRLSSAAISAICWAAKAASHELKVEKIAPASAVPVSGFDKIESCEVFDVVRPLGRFCTERREMGFAGFGELKTLGELEVLKQLALSTAIVVAMVAAIENSWVG